MEMPVPWDDHQEHQPELKSTTEGRAGEVMPALWGAQKIMYGSQTLKPEAVNVEVALETPRCSRFQGYLLRKAANREWNQPRRKKFVAVNKDEKGVGDLRLPDIRHRDAEFKVCPVGFLSCFGDYS